MLADMVKIPEQTLMELRNEQGLSDSKLNALRNFTLSVMAHRGWVPESDMADFEAAGYDECHVLEVLTILAQKTISNYHNHNADTPLDAMFESRAWKK